MSPLLFVSFPKNFFLQDKIMPISWRAQKVKYSEQKRVKLGSRPVIIRV